MDKKKSKKAPKIEIKQEASKSVLQLFADWMAQNGGGATFQVNSTEAAFVIKVMTPDDLEKMQKEVKK